MPTKTLDASATARFAFLRSKEAKERLRPALAPLNVEKTMSAPVTVIIAYDLKFYEQLPKLFPHSPAMATLFASNAELAEATTKRNSSLQGAYLIMAARALGLDCGPMSGFDHAKVDEEFFAAGKPRFDCDQEFFPEGHMTGAVPNTGWLERCVVLDDKGFIKTGPDLSQDDLTSAGWPLTRPPYLLETSRPGVFAGGDVRAGNIKRVASAVGEGSIAVAFVHQVLH